MHKAELVLKNETQKILWDFEIQTDDLFPASGLNLVSINKKIKNLLSSGFYRSSRPHIKVK